MSDFSRRVLTTYTQQMIAPAARLIKAWRGRDPAGIRQGSGRDPAGIRQGSSRDPAGLRAGGIREGSGRDPGGIRQDYAGGIREAAWEGSGRDPAGIRQGCVGRIPQDSTAGIPLGSSAALRIARTAHREDRQRGDVRRVGIARLQVRGRGRGGHDRLQDRNLLDVYA